MALKTLRDTNYFGTMLIVLGMADGLVSGAISSTANTVRPALQLIKTKPGVSSVSGAFLMCLKDHVSVFADCAINLDPNPQQLADIAIQSAETAKAFSIDPKIGLLSYSTLGSGKGPDVDLVVEATSIAQNKRPDLPIVGPIQFDAALSKTVAKVRPSATRSPAMSPCSCSRISMRGTSATRQCSAPPAPWRSDRCFRGSTGLSTT